MSTAMDVFKHSTRNVYGNAMSNYGGFDRMCVSLDTLIPLPGPEKFKTLGQLIEEHPDGEKFLVYAFDHESGCLTVAAAHHPRSSGVRKTIKIIFNDGLWLVCTPDHPCMLRDGSYRDAGELQINDSMMSFGTDDINVVSVEDWHEVETGDMTVDGYENFATCSIVVHNSRYSDFSEMDFYPELSSGLDIYCLAGDNQVPLLNGETKTIKELYDAKMENFYVYSFDLETRKHVPGLCTRVAKTGENQRIYRVTLDDGIYVRVTGNHKFLMKDGTYIPAVELKEGDQTQSFRDEFLWATDQKIVSITEDGTEDVYDLTVDKHHNFAVSSGTTNSSVIVHNSEETVSADETGTVLHVFSENPKIKEILDDLFYDTLNIDFNLTPWVRSLCKFGDVMIFLDVDPNYGVIHALPMPINEVEREEKFDPQNPLAVRFRWVTNGNQLMEAWQVAHFRLLGNDQFLPYGTSVLESSRRIWRQLILAEDAMLVYRVVRSPERRVFYIDVGNIPPTDVATYMEQVKSQIKGGQVIEKTSGRVDQRYSPLPVSSSTLIPLLDGRCIPIKNLAQEFEAGKDNWVYSLEDGKQDPRILPGRVVWCGKNYTASEIYRVRYDDGTHNDFAAEHPLILRDGTSKRADQLEKGDRLMPFYRQISAKENGDYVSGYEKVYDPNTQQFKYTHKLVAEEICVDKDRQIPEDGGSATTHHMDCTHWNNRPDNLQRMGYWEHKKLHVQLNSTPERAAATSARNRRLGLGQHMAAVYNNSPLHAEHNEIRSQAVKSAWAKNKEVWKKALSWEIPDEVWEWAAQIISQNPKMHRRDFDLEFHKNLDLVKILGDTNKNRSSRDPNRFHTQTLAAFAGRATGFVNRKGKYIMPWPMFRQHMIDHPQYKNHSVESVEIIKGDCDVYCMTVEGPNGQQDRHNFAIIAAGQIQQNGHQSLVDFFKIKKKDAELLPESYRNLLHGGIFVRNSVEDDIFIPRRGSDSGTVVEQLPAGANATAIDDINYLKAHLYAALKIPKEYLGADNGLGGSKATLSQLDIKFARTIGRIQRTVLAELNKIAIIHLYSHGFSGEDLLDFDLRLSNPSTIAQQQKLEIWRTKFEIAGSAPEGLVDRKFLRKKILMLSDEEIEDADAGRKVDRAVDMEIETGDEAGSGNGVGGGGGGGGSFSLGGAGGPPSAPSGGAGGEELGSEAGAAGGGDTPGGESSPDDLDQLMAAAGASTELGGEEEAAPPEEEKPEEESDESEESEDLLLSVDDPDDDILLNKLQDADQIRKPPVAASGHLKTALDKRKRRRTHGAAATNTPDFNRMVGHKRPGDTIKDPFDRGSMSRLGRQERLTDAVEIPDDLELDFLDEDLEREPLSPDLQETIRTLTESFNKLDAQAEAANESAEILSSDDDTSQES